MFADVMRYRYDVHKSKDFLSNLLNEQKMWSLQTSNISCVFNEPIPLIY